MWQLRPFGTFYSERATRSFRLLPALLYDQNMSCSGRKAEPVASSKAPRGLSENDGHLRRLVLAVVELWLGRRQRLHGQGLMGLGETAGRSAAKGATKAGLIGLPQRLGPS